MKNDEKKIMRIFPDYFKLFELPEGVREEKIKVYRACKTRRCDKESFTPSFEENGYKCRKDDDSKNPGLYSLSTAEKPKDIKRFVNINTDYGKPYMIAVGVTEESCGIVQRTRERETRRKDSHVDWWLYKDAKPYEHFEMIDDFETYLKTYKKG